MTPRANRSLPPPFFEIGPVKFQELCADLMAEDQVYLNPVVYGRNGQAQRGIDIEAPLRAGNGLHVGQCKAWGEPTPAKVREATKEFLPDARYWCERGLKRFILLIGCAVDDTKTQDQLRRETARFRHFGIEYEWWDARILKRKLRPYPHIVRNHCEPADYWEEFICRTGAASTEASARVGLNAILARQGTLVLELSEARNKELTAILELWEEGAAQEALNKAQAFCQTAGWPELTIEVRAKALRMQAAITLATRRDAGEARRILEQARPLAPGACMALEASIVSVESGAAAGLEILKAPDTLDAWNVRLGLLLEAGKPGAVLEDLPKVPAQTTRNSNTAWAEAMALLCLRRVEEARRVLVDTRSRHPRSLKLRMAMAMIQYASGISTVFPAWGHLTWPVPPPWHLVKRDEEARKQRVQAAEEFEQLAGKVAGDERLEMLIWRLACLANEPGLQREAAALCTSLLAERAGHMPAIVWAQERNFDFDKATSISALRSRMQAKDVEADETIALFSLVADTEGIAAGEKVLDDQRAAFERAGNLAIWRAHKVQCLVARGEAQLALTLVDEEADPVRKRQVRQALLGASARKNNDHKSLEAEYEDEFRNTRDGNALLSCCFARRLARNWSFIADHAEELIKLVGTDAALRMGAEGAINARRPELVLKLLQEYVGLCPGGVLPPDLERLRAEAHKQLGQLSRAVEAVEKAASVSPDVGTLMHLFRMKRAKGDLVGSAETAKLFLKLPDVPAEFLTEEVAPAIRRVAPELTRALVLKAKQSLPEDSPALLLVAQQASKLGLSDITHEVFGKLPLWAQQGVGGIEAVDVARMTEMLRQQAESWSDALQRYRRGLIPVHALCLHFEVILARCFLEGTRINIEHGQPVRDWPILTRHGALAAEEPAQLESKQELFLDVTSILLLHSLNLLNAVESAFPKIAVASRLTGWLQAEADKLQPVHPDGSDALQRALQLFEAGKIHGWSNSPDFTATAEGWAVRMGTVWCERLARVKSNGGVLVDFMPLAANQPEMEPVTLPETEAAWVVGEGEIIAALQASGRISGVEAASACRKLGHPPSAGTQDPRLAPLQPGSEVHLETGIAERLALADVLKPLSEVARVFVHEFELHQWREVVKRHQSDAALLPELERLLAHISQCFDSDHYRGHECGKPQIPPGHQGPLSEKELCVQDCFDYAENGPGTWCVDDRFLRGLRRGAGRPCADVFDLIHHLHRTGRLNDEEFYDTVIRLRAANVRYLHVTEAEILFHVGKAPVERGEVVETSALAVLRRSVAAALLDSDWLQRPQVTTQGQRLLLEFELPIRLYLALAHAMVEIWRDEKSSQEQRAARAKWLWNQLCLDIRLVQQFAAVPGAGMSPAEAVGHSLGHLLGQGIVIPGGERGSLRAVYFEWLFNNCIAPYLRNNSEVLDVVASLLRRLVDESLKEMAEAEKTVGTTSVEFLGRMILMGQFLFDLPPAIMDALRLSPAELNRFGLAREKPPFEVLGVGLDASEFWPAVARALATGYAAILKPGTRLQMTRDDATGRVWIKRKGEGARDGGYLNVPCLMVLSPRRMERIKALQSAANWFDLNESERQETFNRLADVAKPMDRMRELHGQLDKSAAWFYRRFEERAKDPQARMQTLNVSEMLPGAVTCLRRHLRLDPKPGSETEPTCTAAIETLLHEEGLEEAIVRRSCIPTRLPLPVFDRLGVLDKAGMATLLDRLSGRLQSPLQRLQLTLIALKFGDDLPSRVAQAKRDLARLLNPESGIYAANALVALFKWSHLRLGWSSLAQGWLPETRLRVAWVHAGRLHSAFAGGGASHKELAEWITANSQEVSAASISPTKELWWDAASPSGLTGGTLVAFALADLAAQLPTEVVAQLDLPVLFNNWAFTENAVFPVLFSVWHDTTLRSNVLSSYLGAVNASGLRLVTGDNLYDYLMQTPPLLGCERAIQELQKNPHQPGAWSLVYTATNGAPLPSPQAAVMDQVIQSLRLVETLERDALEAEQLILLASDFASRDRPAPVVQGLFQQLLHVATECSTKFRGIELSPGADHDSSRVGAAILEGTWECSLVRNDASASIAKFTDNLPLLISNWPAVARLTHAALTGIMQTMPLTHQHALWRPVLLCRAQ